MSNACGVLAAAAVAACGDMSPQYAPWPPPRAQIASAPASSAEVGIPAPPRGPPGPRADYAPAAGPNAAELGAPSNPQLVTPGQEGAQSVSTAVEAPLHEMNLVRERIPPVLLEALADPYGAPSPLTCDALTEDIERLSVALGPDFDSTAPKHKRKVTGSGGMGLQLLNGAAGNLLPFHGYVGTLSGSGKHDELIIRALDAGSARRAYLKGLGEAVHCPAPASPHHLAKRPEPIYDGPPRPKYPIG